MALAAQITSTTSLEDVRDILAARQRFTIPRDRDGQDISDIWAQLVDNAWAAGGVIVVPAWCSYVVPPVTIGRPGSYRTVHIVGEYYEGHPNAATVGGSKLLQKPATNTHMFSVAASDANDIGPAPFVIRGLTLDGQSSLQSGTQHGINFLDHTATSNKQRGGFIDDVRFKSFRTSGMRLGLVRNAGVVRRCTILNTGGPALSVGSCNDWKFSDCSMGNAVGPVVQDSGGGSVYWNQCEFFTGTTHGYKADSGALDHYFVNCTFDTNGQHGVFIDTAADYPWSFSGCRFQQNSLSANDTYSHIRVGAVNTLLAVTGCNFFAGSTNNPKYVYEFTAGGKATHVGGTVQAGAHVTAFANDPTAINGIFGAKPTVTGSRGGNAALASLLTQLAARGIITDGSSA